MVGIWEFLLQSAQERGQIDGIIAGYLFQRTETRQAAADAVCSMVDKDLGGLRKVLEDLFHGCSGA